MTDRLAGKRVLIVEDERIIALNLATEVASRGAKAIWPAGVDAALNAAKSTGLDGAIIDVNLRDRAAFPIADALADRHIPFVFTTAYENEEGIPARHANARRFEKPTAPGVICCALEGAMPATREG
jgi:DNA-binding response OmpR family regulator